ncbi:Mss4-like protein [Sarocladium implicatum]|nr:Mss4-like protein [Sarocladium implicatum]
MSALRPLRGACQCGRNRYIIAIPEESASDAEVHFNTEPEHQVPLATPLAAYIRVPLSWYHSTTYAQFPDETHALIRRVYTHPSQSYSKRHFCGYCGTPLSYWSEQPHSEADFINLTLGSLVREDLRDLEDMGLIDDASSASADVDDPSAKTDTLASISNQKKSTALRQSYGVPWFDSMVEGTRLGRMRRTQSIQRSPHGGEVSIEWEIVEFADNGDDDVNMSGSNSAGVSTPVKRKMQDRETGEATVDEPSPPQQHPRQ